MQEPTHNQFAAPQAVVADMAPPMLSGEVGELDLWSARARIGRVRYLAYGAGSWLLMGVVGELLKLVFGASMLGSIAAFALGVAWIWFCSITSIKRLHDFGANGWWTAVPLLAPFVLGASAAVAAAAHNTGLVSTLVGVTALITGVFAVITLFWPGTRGANRYGAPPPANKLGLWLLAMFVPVVVVGILAAVAIPQYQAYVQKAKAANAAANPQQR